MSEQCDGQLSLDTVLITFTGEDFAASFRKINFSLLYNPRIWQHIPEVMPSKGAVKYSLKSCAFSYTHTLSRFFHFNGWKHTQLFPNAQFLASYFVNVVFSYKVLHFCKEFRENRMCDRSVSWESGFKVKPAEVCHYWCKSKNKRKRESEKPLDCYRGWLTFVAWIKINLYTWCIYNL